MNILSSILFFILSSLFLLFMGYYLIDSSEEELCKKKIVYDLIPILPVLSLLEWLFFHLPPEFTIGFFFTGITSIILIVKFGWNLRQRYLYPKRNNRILMTFVYVGLLSVLFVFLPIEWTIIQGYEAFVNTPVIENMTNRSVSSSGNQPLFYFVSDLHFSGHEDEQTYLKRLKCRIEKKSPQYLLIGGDMTDAGEEIQWSSFLKWIKEMQSKTFVNTIMTLGNHEYNSAYKKLSNTSERRLIGSSLIFSVSRYVEEQARMIPGMVMNNGKNILSVVNSFAPTAVDIEKSIKNELDLCYAGCKLRAQRHMQNRTSLPLQEDCYLGCAIDIDNAEFGLKALRYHFWYQRMPELFPLSFFDEKNNTYFIVMESVLKSSVSFIASGVGFVSDEQLNRLNRKLESLPSNARYVVILIHHALIRSNEEQFKGPDNYFSFSDWTNSYWWSYSFLRTHSEQAKRLLDMVNMHSEQKKDVIYIIGFGHCHRRFYGRYRNVWIIEAPSLKEENGDHGFFVATPTNKGIEFVYCDLNNR